MTSNSSASKDHRAGQRKSMFFSNLNVFIACLILLAMFAAGPLILLGSMLLAPLGLIGKGREAFIFPVTYLLLALPLVYFWWKTGLAPASRKPGYERRYRAGHWLLAITNISTITAFSLPFMLAKISGNSSFVMLAWFAVPVYALGFLVWGIGLYMVWTSRS